MIDKRVQFHIVGIILYCYAVVYTGAFVRHKNASLACPDWPICNFNQIGLPTQMHEWIQMGHRFLAGILFIWIIYATYIILKHYKHQTLIRWSFIIASILVTLQVVSGAFVVITRLEFLIIALLHALFISCLFGVLSYLVLLLTRSRYNQKINQQSTKSAQI